MNVIYHPIDNVIGLGVLRYSWGCVVQIRATTDDGTTMYTIWNVDSYVKIGEL